MRKIVTWTVCIAILLVLAMPVMAANQLQFTLTPSATQVAPGEKVTFEVVVKGAAYTSVGYIPSYDTAVWEMVEGECLLADAVLGEFSLTEGGVVACADVAVRDGAVFKFTMKVKDNAANGATTVTGMVAANAGGDSVKAVLTDAQITVGKEAAEPEQTTSAATQPAQTEESSAASEGTEQAVTEVTEQAASDAADQEDEETLSKEELEKLEGGDSCLGAEDVITVGATETPEEKENPVVWIVVAVVVVVGAAAAWFFLRKKGNKTEE